MEIKGFAKDYVVESLQILGEPKHIYFRHKDRGTRSSIYICVSQNETITVSHERLWGGEAMRLYTLVKDALKMGGLELAYSALQEYKERMS